MRQSFTLSVFLGVAAMLSAGFARAEERSVLPSSILSVPAGQLASTKLTAAELETQIDFMVALKMRDLSGLQARVANGEHIASDELASKYYPLPADYQVQLEWLASNGFTIVKTDTRRFAIFASGKIAQIQAAFQVQFGGVTSNGKLFHSAITAPSLPAQIAAPVLGINGLQPHLQRHSHSRRVAHQGRSAKDHNPPFLPSEILHAYNADGVTATGMGQKIAIVIDTFPNDTDLTTFWKEAGVNQSLSNIEKIQVVPGVLNAPSGEETLDVEWSSGIAPDAKIRIYATQALFDIFIDEALQAIIDDLPTQPELQQVSISLGSDELIGITVAQMQTDSQYFATLAAMGVTVFVSSGDGGASPDGLTQVSSPANDPSVTAVGGTAIVLDASGAISKESVYNDIQFDYDSFELGASGGGISTIFNRPAFQLGSGVPSGAFRLIPDVAAPGSALTGALVVLDGSDQQFGGTSWGSPTWAGICARINQSRAAAGLSTAGLLGPKIYPLIGTPDFQDITVGNNNIPGFYSAGPGYDLCTGIGTPNIGNLVPALSRTDLGLPNLTTDTTVAVVAPASATVGAPFAASIGVIDTNPAAAGPFIVRFKLSLGTVYNESDPTIGDVAVSGLAGNATTPVSLANTCPTVEPGNYYLVWNIDVLNAVAENNEADNTGFYATPIAVAGSNLLPNLTLDPQAPVVMPATVRVGSAMTVSTGVLNNGFNNAGPFIVRYRLSTDTVDDTSDAFLGDAAISGGLNTNNTATAAFTGVCPDVTPGQYYLVWSIDPLNQVIETNESDNVFYGMTPITVDARNHPPTIDSGPTYTPSNPIVDVAETFSVSASDLDGDPLTYAWDFGDGSTGTGNPVMHTFDPDSIYFVQVTVTDSYGASVTQGVSVVVNLPTKPIQVVRKKFILNFATLNDSLDITFTHPDFKNGVPDGQEIEIDAGAFIIDQGNVFNGVAAGFDSGGRFTIDKHTGQIHYAVKRTQLQSVFAPYGAINATVTTTTMPIPFSIITGGINYTGNFTFAYKATMGRIGTGN